MHAVVGLTAGTSTPDDVIDRVEARIRLCAETAADQVGQVTAQTGSAAGVAERQR
jgi:4-hydroxy-3-methylbut-2-enyl diphosphate reductase IspH